MQTKIKRLQAHSISWNSLHNAYKKLWNILFNEATYFDFNSQNDNAKDNVSEWQHQSGPAHRYESEYVAYFMFSFITMNSTRLTL